MIYYLTASPPPRQYIHFFLYWLTLIAVLGADALEDQRQKSILITMKLESSVVIERDVDGWSILFVTEVIGSHPQAEYLDAFLRRTREAIEFCLEMECPEICQFLGVQRIEVSA